MTQERQLTGLSSDDWAVLYAKFCGELAHYIESILEGDIDLPDLRRLYITASNKHHAKIVEMSRQVTEAYQQSNKARSQLG